MKKKNNWFKRILIILILLFISLYISSVSGYYEAKISDKVALTDKEIRQFEQDVIDGKEVYLNNYIVKENKNYSNKFTEAGEKVSEAIEKIITEGISGAWDAIKVLFF